MNLMKPREEMAALVQPGNKKYESIRRIDFSILLFILPKFHLDLVKNFWYTRDRKINCLEGKQSQFRFENRF